MENTYFNYFCELLDNNTPLDEYTANSLYYKLKFEIIQPLKSEINKNLMIAEDDSKRKYYLMFLLSEIERQNYIKDAGLNYIEKHLETYNVQLQDVLDFKLSTTNPDFYHKIIDVHYKSLRKFSPEKDEAFLVQSDFVNYFCKIMADEIISFINDRLKQLNTKVEPQQVEVIKEPFKKVYLEEFCKALNNENILKDNNFILVFTNTILHFAPYLQEEIKENLINLDQVKQGLYIDIVKNKIQNTSYYNFNENLINNWLKKYNEEKKDFPYFNKGELYEVLKRYAYYQELTYKEHSFLEDIQIDFFQYGSMLEAKKMIEFIDGLIKPKTVFESSIQTLHKTNSINPIFKDANGKELFDRIVHEFELRNTPDAKQAKIMTMWGVKNIRETIFKKHIKKKKFIEFINNELDESYAGRSTSDSKNYQIDAENCLNLHLKELSK